MSTKQRKGIGMTKKVEPVEEKTSKEMFLGKYADFLDAGAGIVHVRANEVIRTLSALREYTVVEKGEVVEWDVVSGFREFKPDNIGQHHMQGDNATDLGEAFTKPLVEFRKEKGEREKMRTYVYNLVGLEDAVMKSYILQQLIIYYHTLLPSSDYCVVMLTRDVDLDLKEDIFTLKMPAPTAIEHRETIKTLLEENKEQFKEGHTIDKEDTERIARLGLGMTRSEFDAHCSLALIHLAGAGKKSVDASVLSSSVKEGKVAVLRDTDLLSLVPEVGSIDEVGGMAYLKDWLKKRKKAFSPQAVAMGVERPKGIILVGPPGTGKSLVGAVTGTVFNVPAVRLDFGRMFQSLMGESEKRMRSALALAEAISPAIIFCDEVDKGLGGIVNSAGGDSGVSTRVLGTFLTWLQENTANVFVIMTANNVTGLPPELLRRGRFDGIFSTSLPTPHEVKEVLAIHLGKRGYDIQNYPEEEVEEYANFAANIYSPAEIEASVKDALIEVLWRDAELTMRDVLTALTIMTPLSKSFAQQMLAMKEWAENNATPVNMQSKSVDAVRTSAKRIIRRPGTLR